jgi:hypothetical protein
MRHSNAFVTHQQNDTKPLLEIFSIFSRCQIAQQFDTEKIYRIFQGVKIWYQSVDTLQKHQNVPCLI